MRWLSAILLAVSIVCSINADAAVKAIFGAAGDATGFTPIPLASTTLCLQTECPLFAAPSFVDSSRFWGISSTDSKGCITSIDGGTTWGSCASQPIQFQNNTKSISSASDGSVISVQNNTDTNTCEIRRSINDATSWSTVFTDGSKACSNGLPVLKCLSNGKCVYISPDGFVAKTVKIESSDNGQSWALTELSATVVFEMKEVAWDGSVGISVPFVTGAGQNQRSVVYSGAWAVSAVWPDASINCLHSMVLNSAGVGTCYSSGEIYAVRNSAGGLVKNITLPGMFQGLAAGGFSISPFTNVIYIASLLSGVGAKKLGVWISTDNGVSFILLYSSPLNISVADTINGNMFYANGCVYVAAGSQSMFGKIC